MNFPHSVRYSGASLIVALSLLVVVPVRAQRPAPKPAPAKPAPAKPAPSKPAPAVAAQTPAPEPSPAVTFDTLLSADAYGIYAEMRMVGRHAGSQEFAQLLAPFGFEDSSAPAELLELYKFIETHADVLMTSRLLFATMPARAGLPETLLAVEMPSVEEARKFLPELRQFIAVNVAPPPSSAPALTTTKTSATPEASNAARRRGRRRARARAENAPDAVRAKPNPVPQFQIKRTGNLIAMSGATFTFKDLHGTDQALLVNEPGFQAARTRFSTDTLFVYFNTVRMSNSAKQHSEALEKEYRRQEELAEAQRQKQEATANANGEIEPDTITSLPENATLTNPSVVAPEENLIGLVKPSENETAGTPEPTPTPKSEKELEEERQREESQRFAKTLASLIFDGRGGNNETWPESIGVGASLEADALVVRGLFVSAPDEQALRPIPFFPALLSGPAIASDAPAVLPADTNVFVSVSLDLPQTYDYLASLMKIADLAATQENGKGGFGDQLAAFEKTNNFRIREELLTALGNEIAIGMPGNEFFGSRTVRRRADDSSPPPPSGPIVVIALNDKESLQKLLPRVLNAVGFAGATEQSVVEKHGQVEVLAFSNGTLAFIDRFLVGAPDAATMRRVTDAYNSGQTLANNERFRDSRSWQPGQGIGQVYIANDVLKGMLDDVTKSVDDIDDPAIRAYLLSLDPEPGSITHLATRESDGLMHELRLPKNLLSLFMASGLVSQKLSTLRSNETMAQWKLRTILGAQEVYKQKTGRYATLAELDDAAADLPGYESAMVVDGYEIKVYVSGDTFEATATPTSYPKLGRRSFYIDQTGSLRGDDMGGRPASQANPIIE
ncbi:MAG TPA: hypothetical protein VD835_15805 [Pyrinomonadaceae bacterium]|nr:hypothetical protein [Pyrinomonadaceae bacterium]